MKKTVAILAAGALAGVLLTWLEYQSDTEGDILRNEPGAGSRWVEYTATAADGSKETEISLEVQERELSGEARIQLFEDARAEFEAVWLGNNASAMQVCENLMLPASLQDGLVEVTYDFDNYEVADSEGTIYGEKASENGTDVLLTVTFSYLNEEQIVPYYFRVVPKTLTGQEKWEQEIQDALQEAETDSRTEQTLHLPEEVAGTRVIWRGIREYTGVKVFLVSVLLAAGGWLAQKERKKAEKKQKDERLKRQYPVLVNQLSLLMGAGMSVTSAWKNMVELYETNRKKQKTESQEAYEEMAVTWRQMQHGVSQQEALEDFGRRIGSIHYRRLSLLLTQNLSKGAAGLGRLLEQEAAEMFEERIRMARKAGEEAGTKLLFPMILMLVIIIVILIIPAFLNM